MKLRLWRLAIENINDNDKKHLIMTMRGNGCSNQMKMSVCVCVCARTCVVVWQASERAREKVQ